MRSTRRLSLRRHLTQQLTRHLTWLALAGTVVSSGCKDSYTIVDPPAELSLDTQLRATIGGWGTAPILPVAAQNPALVDLGRSLFFDKILSGNRDVSCATCHDPFTHAADALSLPIGTGGTGTGITRVVGPGRQFVPRNAPSLLNQGLGFFYLFWDGRVNEEGGPGRFRTPTNVPLPSGLSGLLAAQAMLPVLNRDEMRGIAGDKDLSGNPNELAAIADASPAAIWAATMKRVLAVQAYQAKFNAAYPGVPTTSLGFEHAANAIAAFEIEALTRTNSPFDRFLHGDNRAMSTEEKRGGVLFFGKARCSTCHFGPLLGGQSFANIGAPQIGPGVGKAAPLDMGRGEEFPTVSQYKFAFRVQPLRNVELTAPYMHSGAYPNLEAVVRHYNNADSAQRNFDPSHLAPAVRAMHHGDAATVKAVLDVLDFRLREPLRLTAAEQADLVAFLKSLTDPSARNLSSIVPASVPSGLAVR
jgi:cytochrome c peroxidase